MHLVLHKLVLHRHSDTGVLKEGRYLQAHCEIFLGQHQFPSVFSYFRLVIRKGAMSHGLGTQVFKQARHPSVTITVSKHLKHHWPQQKKITHWWPHAFWIWNCTPAGEAILHLCWLSYASNNFNH